MPGRSTKAWLGPAAISSNFAYLIRRSWMGASCDLSPGLGEGGILLGLEAGQKRVHVKGGRGRPAHRGQVLTCQVRIGASSMTPSR